ncbi:MAG: terminase [Alphaproteobacteria bacterium]|nr:MAG: terminase [Alphaproteobacteria bacterium]
MPRRFHPSAVQRAFLEALAAGYSVGGAAEAAGIDRATPYRWRHQSIVFAREWDAAWAMGADALEDEALRRAVKGTEKPVFRGGEVVGHVREFSDTMLMQLLKARKPEKYGGGKDAPAAICETELEEAKHDLLRKFRAVADEGTAPALPVVADTD